MSTETDYGQFTDGHGVTTNRKWTPTDKELAAYKKRDLALAVHNLRSVPKEHRANRQTIHSPITQLRAIALLDEEEAEKSAVKR